MTKNMIQINETKLVKLAKKYNSERTLWHNHFLATNCIYNKSNKFQVIIENEITGDVFVTNFDKQPTDTLKLLEDLFFQQNKEK